MFDKMAWTDADVMLNLVTAAEAGNRNVRVATGAQRWKQSMLAHGAGNLVVFDLMTERTCHAATAAVDLAGVLAEGSR